MNLYLVRHARQASTLCNLNVELSEQGITQAKLLTERLRYVTLDALYSSNLIRAIQTADMVNTHHNLTHEVRESIKEIDFGHWTGLADAEIKVKYQDFIIENAMLKEDLPYPGGENGRQVIQRVLPTLEEIIHSGKENVLIVTHGGVIRALCAHLLGMDLCQKGLFGTALEHTSITQFVYHEEVNRFYLQRFNDYAHLEGHPELMRSSWK